jgi:hypothetical protein
LFAAAEWTAPMIAKAGGNLTDARDWQSDYSRKKAKPLYEVKLHAVVDPKRRKRCQKDPLKFLRTYFPAKFYNDFTADHKLIVKEILHRAKVGGDKAIAAPRGEGKTTIAECCIVYLLLFGLLKFPVIVAATGPHASRILENIKFELEFNDLLFDDFPEVCCAIRHLEGAPQRAAKQTHGGKNTHIEWSREVCVLPTIEGSKASGAVIKTFGLDAAIRGVNHHGRRPDFVLIDDPETRDSAASDYQIETREQIIDRDIAGLAGQGNSLGRLALCTLQNRKCLSAKLTDPKQKPSWGGSRYAMLAQKPEREDLWDEYVRLVQEGGELGTDPDARIATEFYKTNRKEMDAGASVSNPHRFVAAKVADGSPAEISALQHCYNIIARIGWNNFATEYQNDPPEEDGPQGSGITASMVRSRLNGFDRRLVPRDIQALTGFIDVGQRACHWVVIAWKAGATGFVVDYGVQDVYNADRPEGPEPAILSALMTWRDRMLTEPYCFDDGEIRPLDKVLVDSGNWDTTIHRFIRDVGGNPFASSKGFGTGKGQKAWHVGSKSTSDCKIGNHWKKVRLKEHGVWLHELHSDFWKQFTHDRFMTPTLDDDFQFRKGALSLFGANRTEFEKRDSQRSHTAFAAHIVAEILTETMIPGKGVERKWKVNSKQNHWLDCVYGACAAADMCGVSLFAPERKKTGPAPTARELAAMARRA